MIESELDCREELKGQFQHFVLILNDFRDSNIPLPPPLMTLNCKGLGERKRSVCRMIFRNFKLGKLNHIAIATRDAKSHLNFFGNVLKAEIGDKLVIKQAAL